MSDREEFEKWAGNSGYALLKTGLNQYFYADTGAAWDAWQAAIATDPMEHGELHETMTEDFKAAWENGLPLESMEAKWAFVGWQAARAQSESELTDARDEAEQWKAEAMDLAKIAGNAAGKCDDLKDEAEKLRGRVSELERTPPYVMAYMYSKQAEAIEAWLNGPAEMGGLDEYAQRLRNQADELEAGGGDE